MGVFGSRARSRLRRRVEQDFAASPAWRLVLPGRAWLCPFCAEEGVAVLPEGERSQVEAILDHLDGPCPGFQGGEGEERPLHELKRLVSQRELSRRVKKELIANPSWQLIDLQRRWFCPFCGEGTAIVIPADRRMTPEVLRDLAGHVEGCYAYERGKGAEKPFQHLKAIVKYANQSRKLAENVRRKLEGDPAWRRKDPQSRWICPYCLRVQEHIDLSSNLLMFENAPGLIAKHLAAACSEFKAGAQPRPLDAPVRPAGPGEGRRSDLGPVPAGGREPAAASRLEPPSSESDIPATDPRGKRRPREGDFARASEVWGRDGMAAQLQHREGTTLRKLESSGEFHLIDDPEVRRIASRPQKGDGAALALPPGPEGAAREAPGRRETRTPSEWRREIERELESVMSLAPGGASGEFAPGVLTPGSSSDARPGREPSPEQEVQEVARRLRLAERGLELVRLLAPADPPRGEFLELLPLGNDRLGLVAGGVAGQDSEGPLVAALARGLLRQKAAPDRCPGDVLRAVNAELFADLDSRAFLTLLFAVVDLPSRAVRLARAGLTAPLVANPLRNPSLLTINPDGMVLGVDKGPIFDSGLEVRQFELLPGDLFVVFTHGVLEARGNTSEEFGVERMHQLVRRYGNHEAAYFCDKFREYFELYLGTPPRRTTDVCLAALKVEEERLAL